MDNIQTVYFTDCCQLREPAITKKKDCETVFKSDQMFLLKLIVNFWTQLQKPMYRGDANIEKYILWNFDTGHCNSVTPYSVLTHRPRLWNINRKFCAQKNQ